MAPATSVFVGGGTPTLVPGDGLAAVLRAIPLAAGAEVTVECNPDDVTPALVETYAAAGVNRVSIGVQSMVPHVLAALGRTHDPANVERAVAAVRAVGLPTFNLDIIYGAAGESLADWGTTVRRTLELDPPHVSAYALTVEAGTPLADDPARHPDDDVQADEYELADDLLSAAGLANYEVSNWARPGHECRHNLLYWRQHDYRGFGCAAHSHRAGRRWWNLRTPERYIAAVAAGRSTEAAGESLDAEARRIEGLQLSLRTRAGVPVEALDGDELPGVVERDGERWVLTRRGRLMANAVVRPPALTRSFCPSLPSPIGPDLRTAARISAQRGRTKQWPASSSTTSWALGRCAGEPVAERRRRRAVERAVPEAHRADDVAELDVGRRDLQGDVVLQAAEPVGDGVDDAGGHRVEGPGHGLDLRPSSRIGALEDVLARQVEVARPWRHERGEHGADVRGIHLRRQLGDGTAIVGRVVEDARRRVRLARAATRRRCRPLDTSAGWRAATASAWTAPADQPSTAQQWMSRWWARAATSSANVPTVPSGCGELPPAPGRSTAISRTPTDALTASSGCRARRESGVPWT